MAPGSSHNKLWGSLGSPPTSAGPEGKAAAGVAGGSPAEVTGCRAVFGRLRARREGPGEGKGLGKQAVCMLCGQNVAASGWPEAGALSCWGLIRSFH